MNIGVEAFRLVDRDAVRIRITYTIDGFAMHTKLGMRNPRMRLFEVFKDMHVVALRFIAKLIMSDNINQERTHHVVNPNVLPVHEDFIDAEIVEP